MFRIQLRAQRGIPLLTDYSSELENFTSSLKEYGEEGEGLWRKVGVERARSLNIKRTIKNARGSGEFKLPRVSRWMCFGFGDYRALHLENRVSVKRR